ncbi:MAG: hypothetical protein OXR84_00440 [Magnetovibrio sp.]|nr:hypothetical protein [Magnetovibrio sp.]
MPAPTVIVHDLAHADAALAAADAAGVALVIRSAPGAAAVLGPGVFNAIAEEARQRHPSARVTAVLDCGDEAGAALAAIRRGCERIAVDLPAAVRAKIDDLAAQAGVATEGPQAARALDLAGRDDPRAAVAAFLSEAIDDD